MKIKLVIWISFLAISVCYAQDMKKYKSLTEEATELYSSGNFFEAALKFEAAFASIDGKAYPVDRYKAATAFALDKKINSAFYHLNYLAEGTSKYRDVVQLISDTNLQVLHTAPQWEKLLAMVEANKALYEKDMDKPLMALLDSVYKEDQILRRQISSIAGEYGYNSKEMSAHWKVLREKDSLNLIVVEEILDTRGWLGAKVIGSRGNMALFLVIQHSPLTVQEKYLPMMREAVTRGNANPYNLALLEDRVATGQGRRQIYGSQIGTDSETGKHFVYPLLDPENVNERRARVGLNTIEQYISRWGIEWDAEKHKDWSIEWEAKHRNNKDH
jgi:hypothetical protein